MSIFRPAHAGIDEITKVLFEAERRRIAKDIEKLITDNDEAWGLKSDGFLYGGQFYTAKEGMSQGGMRKISLHYNLSDRMEQFEKEQRTIESDATQITQNLVKVWDTCERDLSQPFIYNLRDNIPDCIVPLLSILRGLKRSRPIGSIFDQTKEGQRNYNQYMKIVPKIEYYFATRLLY